MCAPTRYTTRHRSVKRIFSFSSGTLNRLGSRGAVIGAQLAMVPPACSIFERAEADTVTPLPPRPAVLPIPEPGPRPLRMRARCEPGGLRSVDSVMCRSSGLGAFARGFAFGLGLGFVFIFAFGFAIAYSPAFAFAGVTWTR